MEKCTVFWQKLLLFVLIASATQNSFAFIEARITNNYQDVKITTFTETSQQEAFVPAGVQDFVFARSINECFVAFHIWRGEIPLISIPRPFCTDARFVLQSDAQLYLVN